MNVDKFISYQIQRQFPAIYQEDGAELVEFVKAYYKFLEEDITGFYVTGRVISSSTEYSEMQYFANKFTSYVDAVANQTQLQSTVGYSDVKIVTTKPHSVHHNRRLFEYNDIDGTLDSMLKFYKSKYLNGLPFTNDSIRFAVKHILDLYRRKGTKEGLELFFRLFYSQNVSVYYPSQDMLKPSSSTWKSGQYIELYPKDPTSFANMKGVYIYGSVSGAIAVVDRVNFSVVGNTLVPIIYISDVKGSFVGFDDITSDGVSYGIVRGSLHTISLSNTNIASGMSNNHVGDILNVTGTYGFGGKARVTEISSDASGEIAYTITDGGFGYTVSNTDILMSDQVVFINNIDADFKELEYVTQPSTGAIGIVMGQKAISSDTVAVGVLVKSSNTFSSSSTLNTYHRPVNLSEVIQFASPRNDTSSASIGPTLTNVQRISIITDLIEDFVDVNIDATNYSASPAIRPMTGNAPSGLPAITINTTLANAFVFKTFDIGTITELVDVNPGSNYVNDVFVLARENTISRFGLSNQIIEYDPLTGINVEIGNVLVQHDSSGNTTNRDIRGIVRSRTGNNLEVMQLSFLGFSSANTMYVDGSSLPISISSVQRDYSTLPIGLNAQISGAVSSAVGKVQAVEVYDSGIGFLDSSTVSMTNASKEAELQTSLEIAYNNNASQSTIDYILDRIQYWKTTVVTNGIAGALGQGSTEGVWESKTSHLNSKKVIQDSDFYQDFSYQISSKLSPSDYITPMKDIVHVAGTKVFHKFSIEENINTKTDVTLDHVVVRTIT